MKQSVLLSDSVHIMVYLATVTEPHLLKSDAIADSILTNPSNVRKIMGQLKKAGLITSQQGKASPQITKPLTDISLLDIFKSLPGENELLSVDKKNNLECKVGANIQAILQERYQEIQKIAEEEMAKTSLAELVSDLIALTATCP